MWRTPVATGGAIMSRSKPRHPSILAALLSGALLVAVSSSPSRGAPPSEPAAGPRAPALRGDWLNSKPLTPADLRGKVVLVEFWTFDCINCQRTIPAMKQLHARLGGTG